MQNAVGQLGFAIAAIALAVGAICFLFLGLKELYAAMQEYIKAADRDEEYQKLTRVRANNLKSVGFFFRASTLFLAAGLALDVFNGNVFWTYPPVIALAFFTVWRRSEKKYIKRLKKELGLK